MADEKTIDERNTIIDRTLNPPVERETITVEPDSGHHVGDVIAAATQLKGSGLVQGHEVTDQGVVIHLWPKTANRVIEMGGHDAYREAVITQLKARGIAPAPTPEEKKKLAAEQQAREEAEAEAEQKREEQHAEALRAEAERQAKK